MLTRRLLEHEGIYEQLRYQIQEFERPPSGGLVERAAYADLHGFLPENVLRGSDRMSMAHSLEVRAPISGYLSSVDAEIGQGITRGQRIGQIDRLVGLENLLDLGHRPLAVGHGLDVHAHGAGAGVDEGVDVNADGRQAQCRFDSLADLAGFWRDGYDRLRAASACPCACSNTWISPVMSR